MIVEAKKGWGRRRELHLSIGEALFFFPNTN